MLACVTAYNDFLIEWVQADPRRFIPIMAAHDHCLAVLLEHAGEDLRGGRGAGVHENHDLSRERLAALRLDRVFDR